MRQTLVQPVGWARVAAPAGRRSLTGEGRRVTHIENAEPAFSQAPRNFLVERVVTPLQISRWALSAPWPS